MNKRTMAMGAVTVLLFGPALPANADSHWPCPEEADAWPTCFHLWTECFRLAPLLFINQDQATEKINEEAVENAVLSRIRAANLFARPHHEIPYWLNKKNVPSGELCLHCVTSFSLSVDVVGRAFSVVAKLRKWRVDPISDKAAPSTAWETGTLGQGGEAFILESVRQTMDKFTEEYLRVNDIACRDRWRDEAASDGP